MSYLYVKAKNAAQLKDLCSFLTEDLKVTIFGGKYTPASYAERWAPTHLVLGFDPYNERCVGLPKPRRNVKVLTPTQWCKAIKETHKPYVKSDPEFLIGFEIEGFVESDSYDNLFEYADGLYEGKAVIDEDESLHDCPPGFEPIEISTPPLPLAVGMERLEWLLSTLMLMNEEGLFITNTWCGFHVSISEQGIFTSASEAIRKRFVFNLMQCFDPEQWKRAYRRLTNKYCWYTGPAKDPEDIHRVKDTQAMAVRLQRPYARAQHWNAINTQHVDSDKIAERRIEIRCAGGNKYHVKLACLERYLLDIERAIEQAHERL